MTFLRRQLQHVDVWVLIFILVIGSMLATLSVMRYRGYNASMLDLGNMSQAIWSATQGRPLECTYRDGTLSRLALHAEVIYFLFAPIYALFPSPVTLLIIQAFLFSCAGFPLYSLAYRHLKHIWISRLIVLIYLLYPVALTAVLFDFHGDTLAMPLLVYMLNALDRRSWREYSVWMLLSLSCKFYVSGAIIALGCTLILFGEKKVGWWTAIAGCIWGLFAFLVLKKAFTPSDSVPIESTSVGYITQYFGKSKLLLQPSYYLPRIVTALIILCPAVWLGWRGWRWLLPIAAIIIPALMTIGQVAAYDYRFHHYAIAVPFIIRSILDGAERRRQQQYVNHSHISRRYPWQFSILTQAFITVLFTVYLVDTPLNPNFFLNVPWWGIDSWAYGRTHRDAFVDGWLDKNVPSDIPVMTTQFIAPHIINRHFLCLPPIPAFQDFAHLAQRLDNVDAVILDALSDYSTPLNITEQTSDVLKSGITSIVSGHPHPIDGGVLIYSDVISYVLKSPDFNLVNVEDGLMLFTREKGNREEISYYVEVLDLVQHIDKNIASFDNHITLHSFSIKHIDRNRYELGFIWAAQTNLGDYSPFIAVSRFGGIEHARFMHIGSAVLLPTTEWPVGAYVVETFDVILPKGVVPGSYPLYVGWYDSSHLYAAWTDERSRLGDEVLLTELVIQ